MRLNSLIINGVAVIILLVPSLSMGEEHSDKSVRPWHYTVGLSAGYTIRSSTTSTSSESIDPFRGVDRRIYGDGGGEVDYGVSIGIRYKNWGISLARENENGDSNETNLQSVNNLQGVNGQVTWDVNQPFKSKTWMLAVDHRWPINGQFDWISLVGIGHSETIWENNTGSVTAVGGSAFPAGTVFLLGPHSSDTAIAYRLGGGISYKIFDNLAFNTMLQITDFGTKTRPIRDAFSADGLRDVINDDRVLKLSAGLVYAF